MHVSRVEVQGSRLTVDSARFGILNNLDEHTWTTIPEGMNRADTTSGACTEARI